MARFSFTTRDASFVTPSTRSADCAGQNVSNVANRLTQQDMIIRILNAGQNMPAFGGILHPDEVNDLVAYLQTRRLHPGPDLTQAR